MDGMMTTSSVFCLGVAQRRHQKFAVRGVVELAAQGLLGGKAPRAAVGDLVGANQADVAMRLNGAVLGTIIGVQADLRSDDETFRERVVRFEVPPVRREPCHIADDGVEPDLREFEVFVVVDVDVVRARLVQGIEKPGVAFLSRCSW